MERDGFINLGDVGMKEGRLYLCDRRSDMVIFGGTSIYPAEIGMVLTQCPGVKDCAVFGIPDDELANRSLPLSNACPSRVTPGGDPVLSSRTSRSKFKVPKRIDFTNRCRARTAARSSSAVCATRSGRTPGARFEGGGMGRWLQSNEHLTFEVRARRAHHPQPARTGAMRCRREMLSGLRAALLEPTTCGA